jgi:hypothetical protein
MNGCSNGRMRGSLCPEAWVCPVPEPVGLKVWVNPHQSQPSCSRRAGWKRGRTAQNPPFFRRGSLQSGTDNRDEQGFRLYGVLGLPSPGEEGQKCLPEIRMRVSVFGAYYEFPPSWVLELPEGLVEYHSHAFSEQQGEEGGCER